MTDHAAHRFDPAHMAKLQDPARFTLLPPPLLWRLLDAPDARVIVDLGAGTGLFTAEFARLAPSAEVRAVDVSPEMLGWLRARLPGDVAPRVSTVLADGACLPLPDGEADAAVMIALYHELDDVATTLAEVARVLRAGGRLLIADWKTCETVQGPPLHMRVPSEAIAAAVAAAGFRDVDRDDDTLSDFSVVTATRA